MFFSLVFVSNSHAQDKAILLKTILDKFPQHKAIIGLQNNFNKFDKLTSAEKLELDRFYKLLIK